MSKEWFIVQFKANSHQQAIKNLTNQGFEVFLPLYDFTTRKSSRFANSTRPLFPGYLFIKFDKKDIDWNKVNNTYGVTRLLTFGTVLKSFPSAIIDALKQRCNLYGKPIPLQELSKGDTVKILHGPFSNFTATIETLEANQRICMLIDLMGQKTKIKTKQCFLELLN